jgi:hypothetical protein
LRCDRLFVTSSRAVRLCDSCRAWSVTVSGALDDVPAAIQTPEHPA